MPHSSRRLIRSRPRPRTASALLAFALAGCAVPHKAPAPAKVATAGPLAPVSAMPPSRPAPVAASAAPAGPAPLGEPVVLIAPLEGGDAITAADAEPTVPGARSGKPLAQGMASWYGPGFHGRRTANGERYDMHALTAAHKTLPFGTKVRVRSVRTGKEVVVRINDRGPYKHSRIIDLSLGAITALGLRHRGVTEVVLLRE
ncbi:septal ring lytic transglycosylase RlpA family protein [Hydrogenophaga sp.]|uniref:septal ring lytic transglycosylase RlpA family protein n=1 Tax=Hydrogenophaga sp. TaxID=1904254 RepID=UPI00286DF618|nr:septal ring lytic transglycosylase RlpA family protein [Hydrogenophaga sp.]